MTLPRWLREILANWLAMDGTPPADRAEVEKAGKPLGQILAEQLDREIMAEHDVHSRRITPEHARVVEGWADKIVAARLPLMGRDWVPDYCLERDEEAVYVFANDPSTAADIIYALSDGRAI